VAESLSCTGRLCEKTGAEDVSSTGEARADFAKTDKPLPRRRVHDEA